MVRSRLTSLLCLVSGLGLASPSTLADWLKMDPPPDVDKAAHCHVGKPTCWLATAANMLAGAGYGTGTDVQARADDIYRDLVAHYGISNGGWTDTAVTWWLQSANNTWVSNPYIVVTVYGNMYPKYPWANPNGAQFIGNELRRCQFVGLSISWPVAGSQVGTGGHAITGWGDEGDPNDLDGNPARVKVTDSDRDTGGDVQTYTYDAYNNPNPGRPNEGNGWYFNYSSNHPYIKHIATLCPTDNPGDHTQTQKVVGSYRIHQDRENEEATDLHYRVGTDTHILTYRTTIDWETDNPPDIDEDGSPPLNLTVDWDLSDNPVPYCTWVTITTEFVLPVWNAIMYRDVYFTYPEWGTLWPGFRWEMITPLVPDPDVVDICGGYVVGAFDLYEDPFGQKLLGEYRFLHEYDFNQDPEIHDFFLESIEYFCYGGNFRFGHSYGMLGTESLWDFEDWIEVIQKVEPLEPGEPLEISLDWDGLLPYPPSDYNCPGDIDGDRDTDLSDLSLFLAAWDTFAGDPNWDPRADLDGDGHVSQADLGILLSDWGCGVP